MKFGRKSFIVSVIAFILCLNLGFLSVAYFSYKHSLKNRVDAVKLRYESVAASFEATYETMIESGYDIYVNEFFEAFVNNHTEEGSFIAFSEDGKVLYSSFDKKVKLKSDNSISDITVNGARHILINSKICDKYQMFFAVDVSEIDEDFESLLLNFTISSVVICLFATLILYFAMSRSSLIVSNTVSIIDKIANGDMTKEPKEKIKGDLAVVYQSVDLMCDAVNERIDTANKNAAEKQMIVDMLAKQLSSPIAQISRAAGEIINKYSEDSEAVQNARQIYDQASRIQNMSEKLLDIAVAREKSLNLTSVDVPKMLTDTASWLSRYAKSIGISIKSDLSPMNIKADEELLSILFYNLTENAINACHSGCTVILSCCDGVVSVKDNGRGMDKNQLERITTPFYKVENDGYKGNGSGLGLALCKQIIDVHGAKIRFESELGYGTTVSVDFNTEN